MGKREIGNSIASTAIACGVAALIAGLTSGIEHPAVLLSIGGSLLFSGCVGIVYLFMTKSKMDGVSRAGRLHFSNPEGTQEIDASSFSGYSEIVIEGKNVSVTRSVFHGNGLVIGPVVTPKDSGSAE